MKRLIKVLLGQKFINKFYHLPMAVLANIIYGFPARGLKVVGVTGTDGKTTTVNMIYRILKSAGKKVSMISTINAPGLHVTSPHPFMVQKFVKQARENGDEYLILEVTSHALDQYRFWGIKFDVGVITNITHEHLDYHKTYENYLQTKLRLIQTSKAVIINQGIGGIRGVRGVQGKIITFGLEKGDFNQKQVKLKLKIPGDYNVENALASLSVAFVLGIDKTVARKALENFEGITGRMEEVKNDRGFKIFIDFAHTPNGLEQALKALSQKEGRLIAMIGAEGKRDVSKRAMMGETAHNFADIVIVTAVDPRGELDFINRQISEGAVKAGAKKDANLFVIPDRVRAIEFAINNAKKGDIVGIFGKGHEKSMNLDGKGEIPWSDTQTIRKILDG